MAHPTEDRPDNWVDQHRRELEKMSVSQMGRYAPRSVLPSTAPKSNGDLPEWLKGLGSSVIQGIMNQPLVRAASFGGEAFRRGQEIAQGGVTAGAEALLEAAGGGPGEFRKQVRDVSGVTSGKDRKPWDLAGAAGDVVAARRDEIPSVDLPVVGHQDLLDLQGALVPLPGAKVGAAAKGGASARDVAKSIPGMLDREAQFSGHTAAVRRVPDQGVGTGLRDRLGKTKDAFADVGSKQQAAVDNLTAERLAKQTAKDGGFTYSPTTKVEPKDGFAVSPYPQFETKVPMDASLPASIQKYMSDHADVLGQPGAHLGAWVQDGTVYLDVSVVSKTADEASVVAKKFNQQAYYDLAKGETVPVAGAGNAGAGAGVDAVDSAGRYVDTRPITTIRDVVNDSKSEYEIAAERVQRAKARTLAADEPNVGKRTWTAEEKALLSTLDTGKFSAKNIVKHALAAQDPDVSRVWYEQLRRDLEEHAAELGVDTDTVAAVYSALSPQTNWPRRELRLTNQGNIAATFDREAPTINNIKGADLAVKAWQDNSILQSGTLDEIRAELKRLGATSWTRYPNGSGIAGTGNAEKAIRILNGEDPAKVLGKKKTGSFLDNLTGNEDNVTGDIWAIRAAVDDAHAQDKLTPKQYEQLQNAYRQAAAELGYTPEATQAIVWDSIRDNPLYAKGNMTKHEIALRQGQTKFSADTSRAFAQSVDDLDITNMGGFAGRRAESARNLTGRDASKDAMKRVTQLDENSTTDVAKQYAEAKVKPGFARTAADKVAMQADNAGEGGGKAELGFQNEYFSPQAQQVLPGAKERLRPDLEARTAHLSQEDTLAAAQLSGRTPEWAAKNLPKRGVLSQQITEAAIGVEEKLALADAAAAKLKGGAGSLTPEDRLDALFSIREAAGLLKDFAEGSSEVGRALAARKIALKKSLALNPSESAWREALKRVAGMKATPDRIDKLLEQLALVRGDKAATYRILRGLNKGSGWDMAFEYSQANILSAVPTHAVNVYSGLVQHALMFSRVVLETPISGAMQGAQRLAGKKISAPVGPEDVAGFAAGYLDGLKGTASDTWQLVRRRIDFYDYAQGAFAAKHGGESIQVGGAIPGRLGEIVRTPFKALTIEDMFQTAPAFNGRLRQLATQQARAEGLKGTKALERAAEIARDPSDEMFTSANSFAERYALHARGEKLRAASALLESVPGLRYIVRFTTTPTNIVAMGLDHSPVGLLRLRPAQSVAEKSGIIAEAAIGTQIIGTFLGMLESGEMTGLRPTNKTERDLMEAQGVGPMMIQSSRVPLVGWVQNLPPFNQGNDANKRWVTSSVLGPLIVPYLIAAAIREVESQRANPDPKAMQQAVGAMVRTFADQVPMLQGIGTVQNIMENPITLRPGEMPTGAVPDLLAQTAKTFVPAAALMGMFERMVDQYKRAPDGIAQTIQSIIPVLAAYGIDVGPLHVTPVTGVPDLLGRPVENVSTGGLALFPRAGKENAPSPVLTENSRLSQFGFPGFTGVTKTTETIGSGSNAIRLSPDGAARYQEIAGQLTDRLLTELIQSPAYANKSDDQKAKDFQTKIDFARIEARKRLAEEYMGTITDDFGGQSIVARISPDKARGIAIGMRATTKLADRADFIGSFLSQIDSDPALRDAVQSEMSNKPRGPLMSGTVSRVVDGDTIIIGDKSIRLYGVDVAELNTPEGRAASKALNDFLTGKTITFQSDQQDSFGRALAEVYADGKSVTDWIIDQGLGKVRLPPESDPNHYSLDVYRRVIPLRQQIKSDPVLSAEYVRNGQPFGDPTVWAEVDKQKPLWDAARKGGDTIFQADQKYPTYAKYRVLASQTGGKNPVRKKFIDDAEKQGIPLSKFVGDID